MDKPISIVIYIVTIIFVFLLAFWAVGQFAGEGNPGIQPGIGQDQIIINLTTEPTTSFAVNWRTDTSVKSGIVQYAVATHGPEFRDDPNAIDAVTEKYMDEEVAANYHHASLTDLIPGSKYVYRVGQESNWSEWFQIQMPVDTGAFSFIYFGDAQNDIKSMWSRVIREAYTTLPKVDFLLHAGDLINRHDSNEEWAEWFHAGAFIHAMVPSVMTPGNHEYDGMELSPQWRPQFNLPTNGPEGLEEICYFIDYKNMKLISLSSPIILKDEQSMEKQRAWLEKILKTNEQEWVVVFLHHPLYATKPGRDHTVLREVFKPIFDRYKVDLVLQGHDHAYGRGHNVAEGINVTDTTNGTMYVVSVSGPKMYDVADEKWMDRRARNTQLFQIISVEDDHLQYEAYTALGELYDAFDIIKGVPKNEIVQKIPDFPERLLE